MDGEELGRAPVLQNLVTWQWGDNHKTQVATAVMAWISVANEAERQFRTCYLGNVTLKPQQQQNQDV